jgi:DNA-binding IclR family transcriptional regulator
MPRRPAVTPLADLNAAEGGVATLDRALSILAAFGAENPSPTLSQIAAVTRITPSSVLRLLASFEHAHVVVRLPNGRYTLGPEIGRLHRAFSSSFSLENLVMPVLQELSTQTQESAAYFVPQGEQRLCMFRVDSQRAVRAHIDAGDLLPMERGAAGKVLMAYGCSPAFAKSAAAARIRKDQCLALKGDRVREVAGISAPVFGFEGAVVGAIALIMPSERFEPAQARQVREAGLRLTKQLGGRWPDPA